MRKPVKIFAALMAGLMLALTTQATSAHQQKESVTQVLFNARTGNIEVMHRFLVHDAEHAIKALVESKTDILGSEQSRQHFADYVRRHFQLRDQDGNAIVLQPVGHELDGRFFWVYSEAPAPEGVGALTLSHDALRELWSEQVNLVNVQREGITRTALLAGGEREVTVDLQ
ncbi:MAG: DUF6702 family protein [Pseudomonadota bacterium]